MNAIFAVSYILNVFAGCLANNRCVQAEGRRTLWSAESEVDKVDAEDVLSVLFRSWLPYPQPGLLVRGWCKSR